jgi:hypothetical protein
MPHDLVLSSTVRVLALLILVLHGGLLLMLNRFFSFCTVCLGNVADVSEEHAASFFRVEVC